MRAWARLRGGAEEPQPGDGDGLPVVSARVLDGEHLFLAVRGKAVPLALRTPAGPVEVPADAGSDRHGPLTTATIRLETHADPDPWAEVALEVGVRTGRGVTPLGPLPDRGEVSGASPTIEAPLIPDGRARWHVGDGPGLVLTRRPEPPVVPVLSVRGRDDETEVRLGPGPDTRVEVRHEGQLTAALDLAPADPADPDGPAGHRSLRLGHLLATSPPADLTGGVLHADGHPLARTGSHLRRPQRATELPPLPGGLLELRWTPAGHLALRPRGRGAH